MPSGPHHNREASIIASVPCPTCGAKVGERCKGLMGAGGKRGNPPLRSDADRRRAWQEWKKSRAPGEAG